MIRIFLAHASEDKEAVIDLYNRLREKGFQPWLDKKDLLPGQNWRSEIPKAIQNSDIFLACLSQRSVTKKGYVQKEFKLALSKCAELPPGMVYLIPLRLDECEIPELRQEDYGVNLRDLHWVDYFETDGFDMLVRSIDFYFSTSKEDTTSFTADESPSLKIMVQQYQDKLRTKESELLVYREQYENMRKMFSDFQQKVLQGMSSPKYDLRGAQIAGGVADKVQGDQVGGTINNQANETLSIVEAATEIQNLLKPLEASNPNVTEADQTAFLNLMIPPTRRERFIGALKSAGNDAIEEVPYGTVLKALVEGWQRPNG